MRSDLVDIEVTLHYETKKMVAGEDRGAYLVESFVSSPKKVWMPKSLCEIGPPDGGRMAPANAVCLTAKRSILEKKGLV